MAIDTQAYYRMQTSSSKPWNETDAKDLTLSIALNPKSKLTLERGINLINRNIRAC